MNYLKLSIHNTFILIILSSQESLIYDYWLTRDDSLINTENDIYV